MSKFRLYELLLSDGVAHPEQFHPPERPPTSGLSWFTPDYVQACEGTLDAKAQRRIGLPWSPALVNRTCTAVGGTILTAQLALSHGLQYLPVELFSGYGSGFVSLMI